LKGIVLDELEEIVDWLKGYSCVTAPSAQPINLLADEISAAGFGVDNTWWESIAFELSEVRRIMGPKLAKVVAPSLDLIKTSVRARHLQMLRGQAQTLQSQIRGAPAASAALDDFVASVFDPNTPARVVQWRRDATVAICERAGRSWRDNVQIARGVLSDRLIDVARAKEITDRTQPDWPTDLDAVAGLDAETRLDLARQVLLSEPPVRSHAVWFALDRARLHSHPTVTVGAVTFFDGGRVRDALANPTTASGVPEELKSPWVSASDIPDEPYLVMARVELGRGAENDAVAHGRELLTAVVSAASFRAGLNDQQVWRLFEGYLHVVDGEVAGASTLRFPDDHAPGHNMFESVSLALNEMSSEALTGTEVPLGTTDALRWLAQAARAEPAMSVMLAVRVIEFAAQQAGSAKWHIHNDDYFAGTWVRNELVDNLIRVVRRSVGISHSMFGRVDSTSQAILDGVLRDVFRYGPGAHYEADISAAVNSLGRLLSVHPPKSALGRELRSVQGQVSSLDALQQSIQRYRIEWRLLLRRLQRVRNGITHGSDGAIGIADQVSFFGRQVASLALGQSLEAALAGSSALTKCQELRRDADNWISSIVSARSPADALIGPAP
jgi:hypothetical protein